MALSDEIEAMAADLKARGISLRKLCREAGTPYMTVYRWRKGGDAKMETWTRVQDAYAAMVSE